MDTKRVLIVDDEPSVRAAVTRMLRDEYTVLEAADGEQALDIAKEQKLDLIFMDIMMP
ncbi:MAG: response regulator, partial [Dehalococcoidia bacterium]